MPVYYTICPAPVPVVKGTYFNEFLTRLRRFCTKNGAFFLQIRKSGALREIPAVRRSLFERIIREFI